MSLFKKRKNLNIRQRRNDDDEEDIAECQIEKSIPLHDNSNDLNKVNSSQIKPQIVGPTETYFGKKEKKKVKPKSEKKIAILSFEDELEADDGIVFQEKKSSLSYRLRKEMKKERKEKKKEKDKFHLTGERDKKDKNSPVTVSDLADLGIRIVNGREAEIIATLPGESDDSEDDKSKPTFRPKSKLEGSSLQPWKAALQSGHIPDANLIHQIRKERQKARERGDFLPLDETVKSEETQGRLIRDDDDDRSDDEGDRIKFSVNQEEKERKQRREAFEAAQAGEDSDHDAEWEMQQLKKAGATTTKLTFDSEAKCDNNFDPSTQASYGSGLSFSQPPASGELAPPWTAPDCVTALSSAVLDRPVNYQAEGIIKRLRDSRESLSEVLRRHRLEADNVIDELVASKAEIFRCSSEQQPLTETFKFYQDMRGYVTDLRECLNEKVGEIKRIQDQVYLIYRQKAQKMVQRRRQDVKDQNNEFSPFAGKMAKGDEYRIRRAAEREGRRTRRRRERERKAENNHHDGMSTDDEEVTSQRQTMQTELETIAAESRRVFEDVEEEFSDLRRVMGRFEGWKSIDTPSYTDAYVSFNLPKLFAPYINLQLALWNPLSKEEDEGVEIEKMKWFNLLLLYGFRVAPEISLSQFKEDPDRRLMSNIVERVILYKLKDLVSCFWDPLSHVQSVRLVNLVRHYTSTYPSINFSSKHFKELTQAIIAKIKDSIENDVFIPMFPKSIYESKTSGVSLFFQRQFWSSWKLLGSVLMWHRILSDSVIHDLAIRSLLNLYLLPALNLASEINIVDSLEKTRHVINVLPREWSKNEGGTHAFLGRLEAFLVTLAAKLDPTSNIVELKEICELLKAIGARSQSEIIGNKYL